MFKSVYSLGNESYMVKSLDRSAHARNMIDIMYKLGVEEQDHKMVKIMKSLDRSAHACNMMDVLYKLAAEEQGRKMINSLNQLVRELKLIKWCRSCCARAA